MGICCLSSKLFSHSSNKTVQRMAAACTKGLTFPSRLQDKVNRYNALCVITIWYKQPPLLCEDFPQDFSTWLQTFSRIQPREECHVIEVPGDHEEALVCRVWSLMATKWMTTTKMAFENSLGMWCGRGPIANSSVSRLQNRSF